MEAAPLPILLEDGPVLAVNKPPGIGTQGPPAATVTLARLVREYLKHKYAKEGNVYLGIPHRLDRAVSGVVLFARNSKAARRLAEQFRDRQVRKFYWGIVTTPPTPPRGTLVDWLIKVPGEAKSQIVDKVRPEAKEATLHYATLGRCDAGWLVEIELATGRHHQIRAQLSHHGCPILGDVRYGGAAWLPAADDDPGAAPIALHARRLVFYHPVRYDLVTVTAPIPDYWPPLPAVDPTL